MASLSRRKVHHVSSTYFSIFAFSLPILDLAHAAATISKARLMKALQPYLSSVTYHGVASEASFESKDSLTIGNLLRLFPSILIKLSAIRHMYDGLTNSRRLRARILYRPT